MSDKKNVPKIRFPGFTEPWEQRKVREVTDRYDNLRIPVAASLRVAGTTPYYGANGIQDYVDGYTHDGEFILVAEDGANDLKNYPVKCVKGRIWVNNHAHVLQGKYDCADNQFLAYAISQADIESLLVGGGRAKLNAETLMGIDLLLPNKAEQIRIGKYLAQLDNLITLHQRKLEHVKKMKKSMLQKMFPKKNQLYPEVRFPGFTDAWEQRKLGEIATYRNGKAHEANQLDVGTYELVNLNSISIDGGLKPSGKFIEDGSDTLQRNDLVMVLSDVGHGDLLGRVAIIPENNRYVLNQRVALLRINDDTNTYFLFSIINRYQDYFKKLGAGSSQLNISRGIVENFEVAYPNVAEQRMIADYFQSLDHLITLHQRELDHLQLLKKGMLQQMFI